MAKLHEPSAARQLHASLTDSYILSKDMKKFMAETEKQWRHVKAVVERQLATAPSPENAAITIPTLPQDDLLELMIRRARVEYHTGSTFFRPGSNGEVLESDPGAPRRFVTTNRTIETILPENIRPARTSQHTPLSNTLHTPQLIIVTQPAVAMLQPPEPTQEEEEKAWAMLDEFVQMHGWTQVFEQFTVPQWIEVSLRHLREGAAGHSAAVPASQPSNTAPVAASSQASTIGVDPAREIAETPTKSRQNTIEETPGVPTAPRQTITRPRFTSNANARSSYMDAYAAQLHTRGHTHTRASTRSVGTTYHPGGLAPDAPGNDQPLPGLLTQLPLDFRPFDLAQDDTMTNSRKKRKRNTSTGQEQAEVQPSRKFHHITAPRSTTASSPSQTSNAMYFGSPGIPAASSAPIPPPSNRLKATPKGQSSKISPTKDQRSPHLRDPTQEVHGTRKGFRTHGPPPHFIRHGGDQSHKLPFRYWLTDRQGQPYLKQHHYKPDTVLRSGDSAAVQARKRSLRGGIDWADGEHVRLLNEWVGQIMWRHGCPVARESVADKAWSAEEDAALARLQWENPGASRAECCRLFVERVAGREMPVRDRVTGVVEMRRVPVRTEQAVSSHAAAKKLWLTPSSRRGAAGRATRASGGGVPAAVDDGFVGAQAALTSQPGADAGPAGATQHETGSESLSDTAPAVDSGDEWISVDEEMDGRREVDEEDEE
ncbi:hypothetical protein NpPPO83_00010602 [Neofusicoccum parvum]|uniref:Uncharacterized protein n=1 Tax=Neofusicoccum parvum TaxID=310453 RepID=A0ACB5SM42_9PEZI|nr:hypothetical protein NpPPO83_00010602 [Neofusicoccum parvum]